MRRKIAAVIVAAMLMFSGCSTPAPETEGASSQEDEPEENAEDSKQEESEAEVDDFPEEALSGDGADEAEEKTEEDEIPEEESVPEESAESEEEEEEAAKEPGDPAGCTIWTLTDLDIADENGNAVGILAAGESSIVISADDEAGLFEVAEGYVDSSLCMIDLAEYLGDMVSYNIANAASSVFTVGGYSVEGITGEVLPGYDGRTDSENVPLLYPAAQKLLAAAEIAAEEGYKLQIVEAYRPYEATRYLYDTMTERLYEDAGDGKTYYSLMTNDGEYLLSAFLAKLRSSHNYGVALDLQLLDEEGLVVSAQTDIHDLSYNSALVYNNDAADILSAIMQEAGFSTLFSEWWHFQDNDAYEELKALGIDTASLELEMPQ